VRPLTCIYTPSRRTMEFWANSQGQRRANTRTSLFANTCQKNNSPPFLLSFWTRPSTTRKDTRVEEPPRCYVRYVAHEMFQNGIRYTSHNGMEERVPTRFQKSSRGHGQKKSHLRNHYIRKKSLASCPLRWRNRALHYLQSFPLSLPLLKPLQIACQGIMNK
jgi:hypothetical protein